MTTFGTDTLCIDSLLTGRMTSGVRLVAQRCYHRLVTPRGMLRGGRDEQNFGLDLASLVGSAVTVEQEAVIGPSIRAELKKDPQVYSVSVELSSSDLGAGEVGWTITVTVKTAEGPFELTLAVSGVTVELLGLEVA